MSIAKRQRGAIIEFYKGGVSLDSPFGVKGKTGGGRRGVVKGWSRSSRRRMREYMLTHEPAADCHTMGATFTVPGALLSPGRMREMWKDWSRWAERQGWAAVWRLELQKRGQPHWHCLVCIPVFYGTALIASNPLVVLGGRWRAAYAKRFGADPMDQHPREVDEYLCARALRFSWLRVLESVSCEHETAKNLAEWPGASVHAAHVSMDGGGSSQWRRYLQDHASKAKQEQVAAGYGRQWGVIGRRRMSRVFPNCVEKLDDKSYFRFLRMYQRMCTPVLTKGRATTAPFGRKLGWRTRRGTWGRSVWYTNTASVKRLVDWARDGARSSLTVSPDPAGPGRR